MKAVKNPLAVFEVVASINEQISQWLYPGFIFATPLLQLQQIPRYISALQTRFEKAQLSPLKDKQTHQEVVGFWQSISSCGNKRPRRLFSRLCLARISLVN